MPQNFTYGLAWFFGASLILVGFWLTGFYLLTGISLALAGFYWWPPSRTKILQHLNLPPLPVLHLAFTLVLFVIALFAFIGRYSSQLEAQAFEAGYETIEEWRAAQQEEKSN